MIYKVAIARVVWEYVDVEADDPDEALESAEPTVSLCIHCGTMAGAGGGLELGTEALALEVYDEEGHALATFSQWPENN